MEYQENFTYLGLDVRERKNASSLPEEQRSYGILSLLDRKNTPCKFFVFKPEILKKLLTLEVSSLQSVTVNFEIVFLNNNWNVRLLDINE